MKTMKKGFLRFLALAGVMSLIAASAFAAKPVALTATLEVNCENCMTNIAVPNDPNGLYSLQMDGAQAYMDGNSVVSQILNNNMVYNLDTLDTLVDGLVGGGTRTVQMHFYSPVEDIYDTNFLPACWRSNYDQNQAVNWAVFTGNNAKFTSMQVGEKNTGWARMDFNVRNGLCDRQIYRYYLRWFNACIERTGADTWTVTSDSCGRLTNYGEASLDGQGGRRKETVYYGDWRLPFKLILTVQQ